MAIEVKHSTGGDKHVYERAEAVESTPDGQLLVTGRIEGVNVVIAQYAPGTWTFARIVGEVST